MSDKLEEIRERHENTPRFRNTEPVPEDELPHAAFCVADKDRGELLKMVDELETKLKNTEWHLANEANLHAEAAVKLDEAHDAVLGWVNRSRYWKERTEKAETKLDAVNDSLRDCNYADCGCCKSVQAALNGEDK